MRETRTPAGTFGGGAMPGPNASSHPTGGGVGDGIGVGLAPVSRLVWVSGAPGAPCPRVVSRPVITSGGAERFGPLTRPGSCWRQVDRMRTSLFRRSSPIARSRRSHGERSTCACASTVPSLVRATPGGDRSSVASSTAWAGRSPSRRNRRCERVVRRDRRQRRSSSARLAAPLRVPASVIASGVRYEYPTTPRHSCRGRWSDRGPHLTHPWRRCR